MDSTTRSNGAAPADPPPELAPARKRGRPPKDPNAPPPAMSQRALASAWQGAFLIVRFLTWVLAGRETSVVVRWTGELWSLSPLTAREADQDAAELAPMLGELPAGMLRVLSAIGAPVLMARRVTEHLQRRPRPAKPAPAATPGPLSQIAAEAGRPGGAEA